jgi:hypothetical protein
VRKVILTVAGEDYAPAADLYLRCERDGRSYFRRAKDVLPGDVVTLMVLGADGTQRVVTGVVQSCRSPRVPLIEAHPTASHMGS